MINYVDVLRNEIEAIRKETRAGTLPREQRLIRIKKASDRYAISHATQYERERQLAEENGTEHPLRQYDAKLLEQLANLALHEELTDKSQYKVREEEYPFLSDMQMARRTDGAHERNTGVQKGEAPFTNAETIATNGRNYAVPKRRKRSIHEDLLRDEQAMIRNKERRRKYNEFTAIQPVIAYILGEFVS
mgnify:CR=1 FL=1